MKSIKWLVMLVLVLLFSVPVSAQDKPEYYAYSGGDTTVLAAVSDQKARLLYFDVTEDFLPVPEKSNSLFRSYYSKHGDWISQ